MVSLKTIEDVGNYLEDMMDRLVRIERKIIKIQNDITLLEETK